MQQTLDERRAALARRRASLKETQAELEREARALAYDERALAEAEHEAHALALAPYAAALLALAPEHSPRGRGHACSDERPDGEEGECLRCALLQLRSEGTLPYGVWLHLGLELRQRREDEPY